MATPSELEIPLVYSRQLLVSFSGIDGAGKSTQISLLRDSLRRQGLRVELITFWDDVVALKRFREDVGHKVFKGDKGIGSPEAPIQRRDKNVQSPLLTLCRMGLYLLDAISLWSAVRAVRREKPGVAADVVIFDRFLYDELANLKPTNVLIRLYRSLLLRIVPRPDLPLVLDADPDAAFLRKPEYPLEFLHANRNAYLELARAAEMIVIPAAPILKAHADIMQRYHQKSFEALPQDQIAPVQFKASAV